jgi:hypothetical protein
MLHSRSCNIGPVLYDLVSRSSAESPHALCHVSCSISGAALFRMSQHAEEQDLEQNDEANRRIIDDLLHEAFLLEAQQVWGVEFGVWWVLVVGCGG